MSAAGKDTYILAVEDNPDTLTLLRYMLGKLYKPVFATRVEEALERADEHKFALILLDINLGEERTGIDLLRLLRQRSAFRQTPALALTAYAMPGDRERFIEAGFDDYVSKPFTRDHLLEMIETTLAKHAG